MPRTNRALTKGRFHAVVVAIYERIQSALNYAMGFNAAFVMVILARFISSAESLRYEMVCVIHSSWGLLRYQLRNVAILYIHHQNQPRVLAEKKINMRRVSKQTSTSKLLEQNYKQRCAGFGVFFFSTQGPNLFPPPRVHKIFKQTRWPQIPRQDKGKNNYLLY